MLQNAPLIAAGAKLGVALQVTNILRDVAEDWRNGHLYLPLEDLKQFGLSADDIAGGKLSPRWKKFMRFQIERVRRMYAEARPGIAMLKGDGRFAIAAAADLYEAILEDIEAHDYDVFSRRAHIGALGKLRRLPEIWFKTQTLQDVTVWYDEVEFSLSLRGGCFSRRSNLLKFAGDCFGKGRLAMTLKKEVR